MRIRIATLMIYALSCCGCSNMLYTGQQQSVTYRADEGHMPEVLRQDIVSVDVVLDTTRPKIRIGGDYGQELMTVGEGVGDGLVKGAQMGFAGAASDPYAAFLLPFILPAAIVTGGVVGAAAAKIEIELAEFREGLTDELVAESGGTHPGANLAADLQARLASTSEFLGGGKDLHTQLILSIPEIAIETYDKDAVVATTATITLENRDSAEVLYSRDFSYAERDKLKNWTESDNAKWRMYAERAISSLGEYIHADLFETIYVRHVLRPVATESFSGGWSGSPGSEQPELAWELFLLGGDPYESAIDRNDIRFDLQIYDGDALVYEATGISTTEHTVSEALPRCQTLDWSVRPVYRVNGAPRNGEWMQYLSGFKRAWRAAHEGSSAGVHGRRRDYAQIKTRCRS